ncbi:MAG: GspH/FimT family pseudopilin [Cellvibrionaceae bacterium]|nr:GspH/FimT family pseudopilin [Cellvibrionaceae bacterium]
MIGQSSNQRGFTLIELMVVIIIAAILLTIAVPSFSSLIKRNNVDSLQSKLSSALATARTEAASRNRIITICASNAGQTACDDNWSNGWIVFEDNDGDGVIDAATGTTPAEALIDVYRNTGGYTVASNTDFISFNSQGFMTGAADNRLLVICEPDRAAEYARGLFVNRSGLVMKTRDTNNDGKHNDPTSTDAATNLSCAAP